MIILFLNEILLRSVILAFSKIIPEKEIKFSQGSIFPFFPHLVTIAADIHKYVHIKFCDSDRIWINHFWGNKFSKALTRLFIKRYFPYRIQDAVLLNQKVSFRFYGSNRVVTWCPLKYNTKINCVYVVSEYNLLYCALTKA